MKHTLPQFGSTMLRLVLLALELPFFLNAATAQPTGKVVRGAVLDPAGRQVAQARVEFSSASGERSEVATDTAGCFVIALPAWGAYTVRVESQGFEPLTLKLDLNAESGNLEFRFAAVATAAEEVIVMGNVSDVTLSSPDPSEKVLVREELLDA